VTEKGWIFILLEELDKHPLDARVDLAGDFVGDRVENLRPFITSDFFFAALANQHDFITDAHICFGPQITML